VSARHPERGDFTAAVQAIKEALADTRPPHVTVVVGPARASDESRKMSRYGSDARRARGRKVF